MNVIASLIPVDPEEANAWLRTFLSCFGPACNRLDQWYELCKKWSCVGVICISSSCDWAIGCMSIGR